MNFHVNVAQKVNNTLDDIITIIDDLENAGPPDVNLLYLTRFELDAALDKCRLARNGLPADEANLEQLISLNRSFREGQLRAFNTINIRLNGRELADVSDLRHDVHFNEANETVISPYARTGTRVYDNACSICQTRNYNYSLVIGNCGHQFHIICIRDWLEKKDTCPYCVVVMECVFERLPTTRYKKFTIARRPAPPPP